MRKIFTLFGLLIIFFILYPLVNLVLSTEASKFFEGFRDSEVTASILLTLRASLWATLIALFFGTPLAWILGRYKFPFKRVVEGIIDLPVIVPHTAAGIALLSVWGRNSMFGRVSGISIMGSEVAISIAMFFVSVPFLINSVKSGVKLVDPRYEKAAITLGASPIQAFLTVTVPLLRRSILSGAIMMWARGISEFGAVVVLAYHPMIAPVLIYDRYEAFGLRYARPVAVILILVCLTVFIILRGIEGGRHD